MFSVVEACSWPMTRWLDQDRQCSCSPPADRGGLASPTDLLPSRGRPTPPLGRGQPRGPEPGTARQPRLHARWAAFDARGKRAVVANAAIARELAGWCWSLAVLD